MELLRCGTSDTVGSVGSATVTDGNVMTPPEGARTSVAVMVRCVGLMASGRPLHISYANSITRSVLL